MTTLIESRSNRLGIEVRHEGGVLRAHRNGKPVAELELQRQGARPEAADLFEVGDRLTREELVDVRLALEEALRVLRDGRGLCEVA